MKKSYEDRCEELASKFEEYLRTLEDIKKDDLGGFPNRLQAHVNLADFKVKFRQADHVKLLQYGPVFISGVSLVLASVLAVFSFIQAWQTRQRARAQDIERQTSLVLKVLEAHSEDEGKRLLTFFEHARLLALPPAQREELEKLLRH